MSTSDVRICPECETEHKLTRSRFCSEKCSQKAYRGTPERKARQKAHQASPEYKAWRSAYRSTPERNAAGRAYEATARARASKRARRSTAEYKAYRREYESTPERRASAAMRCSLRRARKLEVERERVFSARVFQRDQWRCGVCRKGVDPDLKYPHPRSASLDHVIPLSAGGPHTYANVQLAHLTCNRRKGAEFRDTQMRMFG